MERRASGLIAFPLGLQASPLVTPSVQTRQRVLPGVNVLRVAGSEGSPSLGMSDGVSAPGIPSVHGPAGSAATGAADPSLLKGSPYVPRGKRRREGRAEVVVCGCMCRNVRARELGPRNRLAVRCSCPFCGHRASDGGQGCHRRTVGDPTGGSLWICRDCSAHCLTLLVSEEQTAAHGRSGRGTLYSAGHCSVSGSHEGVGM